MAFLHASLSMQCKRHLFGELWFCEARELRFGLILSIVNGKIFGKAVNIATMASCVGSDAKHIWCSEAFIIGDMDT